jgi:HSP20 family protein
MAGIRGNSAPLRKPYRTVSSGGVAMTVVRRPSPLGDLVSLRQAMDRLFEDSFVRPGRWLTAAGAEPAAAFLPLDVRMTGDELLIHAQLPGVKPDEVDVTVENGTLTIAGETNSDTRSDDENFLVREIRRGSVSRTISLPEGLEPDKATADFENGILTLRIPRADQVKPRTIRITPTFGGQAKNAPAVDAGTSAGSAPGESGDASDSTGTTGA